jgi:uncharacterized integral membrane protein (TIGR00697 family)
MFRSFQFRLWLTAASVVLLLLSSIAATKPVDFGPYEWMPFNDGMISLDGAFWMFWLVYAVSDLLTRVYGAVFAAQVVFGGFVTLGLSTAALQIVGALPASKEYIEYGGPEAYAIVFDFQTRIFVASLAAYILGSGLNIIVLEALRRKRRRLWLQFLGSSAIGHTADTVTFGLIAFIGIFDGAKMVNFIITGVLVKLIAEAAVVRYTIKLTKFMILAEDLDAGRSLSDVKGPDTGLLQ